MSAPREFELKLEVAPSKAASLAARGLKRFGGGKGARDRLASVYFDTDEQLLRKHGLSLRVRTIGDRRVQTVKQGDGSGAGLFDRAEWESDIDGEKPDLAAAAGTPLRSVLSGRAARNLKPVFASEVERTTWTVGKGAAEVEVALDIGRISAQDREQNIAELELELRSGSASDLFGMVRSLGGAAGLRIGVLTKSERGYRLAAGDEPVSVKAEPVVLRRGMSSADAFAAIVRSCIRHFRLNEPILLETRSTESLHQARVAMRRLRSALSLFGNLVTDADSEGLKRRLRTASGLLGEGRNLDVYLEGVTAQAGAPEDADEALTRFLTRMRADRERAYDRIVATLDSPRFRRLMLDLLAWTEAGPWRNDPERRAACERRIEVYAAELLAKRRRRVKRRGEHLDRIDPVARHEVRIDAKKLRYASEFFAGLVPDGKSRRRHRTFLGALEKLQGCLGDLNDIQTAREIAADIARQAGTGDGALHPEADHVEAARQDREAALLDAAVTAHEDFVAAKPFWKDFARG